MVSIRVWDWVIMVIFRWGHSDRGHFDLVPLNFHIRSNFLFFKKLFSLYNIYETQTNNNRQTIKFTKNNRHTKPFSCLNECKIASTKLNTSLE